MAHPGVKKPWEIELMRQAGGRLAEVLRLVREAVRPGVSTGELDAIAEEAIRARGAVPAFKGYRTRGRIFPATLCASVNDEVVHGVPGARCLSEGDVISVDVGLRYRGWFADAAFTAPAGEVDPEGRNLLDETEQSLYMGLAVAVPGNRIGDIGHAIQRYLSERGLGIITDFGGHGIGRALHEAPAIPNVGRPGRGAKLLPGMCLAIEPMASTGSSALRTASDGWTIITRDGSRTAHFEHTLVITHQGPQILTGI